jgi:hypothetical protein
MLQQALAAAAEARGAKNDVQFALEEERRRFTEAEGASAALRGESRRNEVVAAEALREAEDLRTRLGAANAKASEMGASRETQEIEGSPFRRPEKDPKRRAARRKGGCGSARATKRDRRVARRRPLHRGAAARGEPFERHAGGGARRCARGGAAVV